MVLLIGFIKMKECCLIFEELVNGEIDIVVGIYVLI